MTSNSKLNKTQDPIFEEIGVMDSIPVILFGKSS